MFIVTEGSVRGNARLLRLAEGADSVDGFTEVRVNPGFTQASGESHHFHRCALAAGRDETLYMIGDDDVWTLGSVESG